MQTTYKKYLANLSAMWDKTHPLTPNTTEMLKATMKASSHAAVRC